MQELRLLTRCYACDRQYDVTHREPGSQFRCRCSKVLTVPEARERSHDAAVVRCSSCGAPRETDESSCGFCGASFTLQEQDLCVICPSCFTRISSQAKFCHSCSTAIEVEPDLGSRTHLECPVCEHRPKLISRTLQGKSILECPSCAGLWVPHSVFDQAVRDHQQQSISGRPGPRVRTHPVSLPPQKGPMYRKCPECSVIMNRENYARRSGIIVDLCSEHGIWFDNGELEALLSWVRDGGHAARQTPPRSMSARKPDRTPFAPPRMSSRQNTSAGASSVERVAEFLLELFT